MADQFGVWQGTVASPRFLCNPVEKRVGDPGTGQIYPMLAPNQHYICYSFQPFDPNIYTAAITDQFGHYPVVELGPSQFICVPTDKTGVTSAGSSTWGRIKVLYR